MALVAMAFAGLASCGGGGGGGGGSADGGDQIIITSVRTDAPDLSFLQIGVNSADSLLFRTIKAGEYQTFPGVQFKFFSIIVRNFTLDVCPGPHNLLRPACEAGTEFQKRVAPATTLRYERSTDAAFSMPDTLSITTDVEKLEPQQNSVLKTSGSITVPSTAGVYYYRACVVPVSGEVNTANNCSSARKVTVKASGPDLTLSNAQVNRRFFLANVNDAGQTIEFNVSTKISNIGSTASTATLHWYRGNSYVTSVPTPNNSWRNEQISSLAPNASTTKSTVIDAKVSGVTFEIGDYHYSACVVASNDANTGNNCISIARVICEPTRFGGTGKGIRIARVIGGASEHTYDCN